MANKSERDADYRKREAAEKAAVAIRTAGLSTSALNAVQATHANGTETCCQVIARLSRM